MTYLPAIKTYPKLMRGGNPMDKLELRFSYEKPTKNTGRYREEAHSSRDIAVGTLYVRKAVLGEPPPQRLRVTIEEEKG